MNVEGNPWPVTLGQVAFGIAMGMAISLYVFCDQGLATVEVVIVATTWRAISRKAVAPHADEPTAHRSGYLKL